MLTQMCRLIEQTYLVHIQTTHDLEGAQQNMGCKDLHLNLQHLCKCQQDTPACASRKKLKDSATDKLIKQFVPWCLGSRQEKEMQGYTLINMDQEADKCSTSFMSMTFKILKKALARTSLLMAPLHDQAEINDDVQYLHET